MRIEDFSIEELIEDLRGTCKPIEKYLPEGMEREDLTTQELEQLDSEIFCCDVCGWWYEVEDRSEEELEQICINCHED